MADKKPPREYTREEFEAWVDDAANAVAARYGFAPETPLRDNALFLYLAQRAAQGRIPEGDPSAIEKVLFSLLAICAGVYATDSTAAALKDDFPADLLHFGWMSNGEIAEGLVGYLLIHRSDVPALFRSRFVHAFRLGCLFSFALTLASPFLGAFLAGRMAALLLLLDPILRWFTPENAARLAALAYGALLAWLLAARPARRRAAFDLEQWSALFCLLAEKRRRDAYWGDAPGLRTLNRLCSRPPVLSCYATEARPGAWPSIRSIVSRTLCAAAALAAHFAILFAVPWEDWAGASWPAAWWSMLAGAVVWIRFGCAEHLRFQREVPAEPALERAVAAWRLAAGGEPEPPIETASAPAPSATP